MRRILTVLAVAALMAAMMVAMAMPAFAGAKDPCNIFATNLECKGGAGGGGGGSGGGAGGQRSFESNGDLFFSGGGGGGGSDESRGGAGGHCTGSSLDSEPEDCHGKNFSGANNQ